MRSYQIHKMLGTKTVDRGQDMVYLADDSMTSSRPSCGIAGGAIFNKIVLSDSTNLIILGPSN